MNPESERDPRLDVIARLYRLFAEGRLGETFDLMASDVELDEPGDEALIPWAGQFRGHAGLQRFYDGLAAGLSSIEIDTEALQILPVGRDQVLALGTERGTSAGTGTSYHTRSAWLWTVHDGRITRLVAYHDTGAMEAAFR